VGGPEIMIESVVEFGQACHFAWRSLRGIFHATIHPKQTIRPFADVLLGAMPLSFVLGVTLGAVIWMQTRGLLERTAGATDLLPTVLAVAVLLELAPIGAGLIVAARTGASLGAELAAMRATEQTDALELLGISPMNRLLGPRILACVLAVPLLHVLTAAMAIGSGFLAEVITGQTTWTRYEMGVLAELRVHDVLLAFGKTFVFGWLIGVAGCYIGMSAPLGAEGVGIAATKSVVVSSLLVLLADVVLVAVIRCV
jgi:phospholipid/cholesterol/gamma-HCH transport system permease protein